MDRRSLLDSMPGDDVEEMLTYLGTSYGGWYVPERLLHQGTVALCAGAGEDVSFDVELNRRGVKVVMMDPTPRAIYHVEALLDAVDHGGRLAINNAVDRHYDLVGVESSRFVFLREGLWEQSDTLRFYAPRRSTSVSHSCVNLQHTEDYFQAVVRPLADVLSGLDLRRLDILKLDIEGAEYAVLADLVRGPWRPSALLVEFDEGHNAKDERWETRVLDAVNLVKGAGYRLVRVNGWDMTFIHAGA